MKPRIQKINRHIQRTLGAVLQREADLPEGILVTISAVEVTPNLRSAKVWIYVQPPERGTEVLESLKTQMYELQGALNEQLVMRPLPRISFRLDQGIDHAEHITKKLAELH